MNTVRKVGRKITVDGQVFSWTVRERYDYVKVRCYYTKSTYVELLLSRGLTTWAVNFHQPSVIAPIIRYAIQSGWNYTLEKQVLLIPITESGAWIEKAGIINYTEVKQYLAENGYGAGQTTL